MADETEELGLKITGDGSEGEAAIKRLSDTVEKLGEDFFSLNAVSTAAGNLITSAFEKAFSLVKDALKGMVDEAMEAELIEAKLTQAYKNSGEEVENNVQRIIKLSEATQKATRFKSDDIQAGIAQLKMYSNLSTELIERITPAVVDLAAATGMDITAAFQKAGMAIESGQLAVGRFRIKLTESEEPMARANDLMEKLNAKFGGQAQAQVETMTGKIDQLKNSWDSLLQTLGGASVGQAAKGQVDFYAAIISGLDRIIQRKGMLGLLSFKDIYQTGAEIGAELAGKPQTADDLNNELKAKNEAKRLAKRKELLDSANMRELEQDAAKLEKENKQIENHTKKILKDSEFKEQFQRDADARVKKEQEDGRKAQIKTDEENLKVELQKIQQFEDDRVAYDYGANISIVMQTQTAMAMIDQAFTALGHGFSAVMEAMFTANKDLLANLRNVWKQIVTTIIDMIGQLIAKLIMVKSLMAIFNAFGGTGFIAEGALALASSFQTPEGGSRVVPGPPNLGQIAVVHGGENINRGGGGGGNLVIQGNYFESEQANARLYDTMYKYQKKNGLSFA